MNAKMKNIYGQKIVLFVGHGGCGLVVGRAVASDIGKILYWSYLLVNCWNDENKEKETGIAPI